jgi:hypothetical protein
MKIEEVHKFVIRTEKGHRVIETTATESELNELIQEYGANIKDIVLPSLKKVIIHEVGQDKRGLKEDELNNRLDSARNMNDLSYFRRFMHEKGIIFDFLI